MFVFKTILLLLLLHKVISWCLQSSKITTQDIVRSLDVSPNNQLISVGLVTKTTIYNTTTLASICDYDHGGLKVLDIKFFSDSKKIAFGFQHDDLKIVNSTNCALINSFSTSHKKVYDIDINMDGTRMVTCGDDKTFRVWNISTSAIFSSTPPLISGGFQAGEVVLSCKLSSQNHVMIGLQSVNTVKIYYDTNYSTPYHQTIFNITGKANHVNFLNCQNSRYIMGSDNGGLYSSNSTNPFIKLNSPSVNMAVVDRTNQFLAYGLEDFTVYIIQASDYSKMQTFNLTTKILSGDFFDNAERLAVGCQEKIVRFFRRCSCSNNTLQFNSTYCTMSSISWPSCISNISSNSSNTNNTNNTNTTESSNSTTNTTESSNSTTNTTESSNSTTNTTNTTDSIIINNTSNSNTSDNLTISLQSMTVQQFFRSFFTYRMLQKLFQESDISVSTTSGSGCNAFETKVSSKTRTCQQYMYWKGYIKLIHPNIEQQQIVCSDLDKNTLIIRFLIVKDIKDPQSIFIVLPNSRLMGNQISPSMTGWNQILTKTSARYNSINQPVVYSPNECHKKQQVTNYIKFLFGFSCLIMFIGIVTGKIVGLELFGVLQLSYFNLMNYDKINLNLYPLSLFKIFNGINIILHGENNDELPSNILGMNMSSEFLNNFNIMFAASILVVLTLSVISFILSRFKSKQSYIQQFFVYLAKQSAVTLTLFNSFNIGFSSGIHIKYSINSQVSSIFHAFSTLGLIIALLSIFLLVYILGILQSSSYGQFKEKFKNSWVNKCYISFLLIYRVLLGLFLAYYSQQWQATLYAVGFHIAFLIYFGVNLPYKSALHNYRSGIIHLTTLIILISSNYYYSMKLNTDRTVKSRLNVPAILELIMLGVCVGVSLIGVFIEMYIFIRSCKKSQKLKKVNFQKIKVTPDTDTQHVSYQ